VLIAAAGTTESLIHEKTHAREGTMIFMHETIQMMRAERAEQLDKLKVAVDPDAALVPLRKRAESLWDHITVGRASTADILIDDPAISSVHAHFEIDPGGAGVSLQDVGSSNGTFVNHMPLQPSQPAELKGGDCVRFGQTIFYYVSHEMLAELLGEAPVIDSPADYDDDGA